MALCDLRPAGERFCRIRASLIPRGGGRVVGQYNCEPGIMSRIRASLHWIPAYIIQHSAHWDAEEISCIRAEDARDSHGVGRRGDEWNSSIHCVKAMLSAKNCFMVKKEPACPLTTSLAGIGGSEGERMSEATTAGVA